MEIETFWHSTKKGAFNAKSKKAITRIATADDDKIYINKI